MQKRTSLPAPRSDHIGACPLPGHPAVPVAPTLLPRPRPFALDASGEDGRLEAMTFAGGVLSEETLPTQGVAAGAFRAPRGQGLASLSVDRATNVGCTASLLKTWLSG